MSRRLYYLTAIDVEGPSGTETVLFSNRRYRPKDGPFAGQPFKACWSRASVGRWTPKVDGMRAIGSDLAVPIGVAGPNPPAFVLINRQLRRSSPERQLDYLLGAGYRIKGGAVRQWLALSKIDGTPPDWADFGDPVFTGSVRKRPRRNASGTTLSLYLDPTNAELRAPLLRERFTGAAGWVDFLQAQAGGPLAPGLHVGDWSAQWYAGASLPAGGVPPGAFHILWQSYAVPLLDAFALATVYRDGDDIKLRISYADDAGPTFYGLFDEYDLYSVAGETREDLRLATASWSESSGDLRVYVDDAPVVTHAIQNDMTRGQAAAFFMPSSAAGDAEVLFRFSAMRFFSAAIGAEDHRHVLDYSSPPVGALHAWEMDEGRNFAMVDHVGDVDLVYAIDRGSSIDGDRSLAGQAIPAVLGTCFNVPLVEIDARLDNQIAGASVEKFNRVRSQGVDLVKGDSYPSDLWRISGQADTLRPAAGAVVDEFGVTAVRGERLTIGGGTFPGDVVVADVTPTPFDHIRPTGSSQHHFTIRCEDITPDLAARTESFPIDSDPAGKNWDEDTAEESPYGAPGNTECRVVTFSRELPQPVTADVLGDPAVYVLPPPIPGFQVPPDAAENVILQLLRKYGPRWTTQVSSTEYGVSPRRIGSEVARVGLHATGEVKTVEAVNQVAQGCLLWVEEDGNGVSSIRLWEFPEELILEPAINVRQGSVISVERVERTGSGGRIEDIDGLRVLFNRNWAPMDETSIPGWVDARTRDFIANEWRTVPVGDVMTTSGVPIFETLELRRAPAENIGRRVLRIAQGDQYSIRAHWHPVDMIRGFHLGKRVAGHLPDFGLPNMTGICTGYAPVPAAGVTTFNVWTETRP